MNTTRSIYFSLKLEYLSKYTLYIYSSIAVASCECGGKNEFEITDLIKSPTIDNATHLKNVRIREFVEFLLFLITVMKLNGINI